MKSFARCSLLVALVALALTGTAAAATTTSVLSTTGPNAPYGGPVQLLGNVTLNSGGGGTVSCYGNNYTTYGLVANSNGGAYPFISEEEHAFTSLSNIFYGANLSPNTTAGTFQGQCSSTTPNITACKVTSASAPGLAVTAREEVVAGKATTVLRLGSSTAPMKLNINCVTSGGSQSATCSYSAASSLSSPYLPYAPVKAVGVRSSYSPNPVTAFEVSYQPFYKADDKCFNPVFSRALSLSGYFYLYTPQSGSNPGTRLSIWTKS